MLRLVVIFCATMGLLAAFQNCSSNKTTSASSQSSEGVERPEPGAVRDGCPDVGPALFPAIVDMNTCRASIDRMRAIADSFNPGRDYGLPHASGANYCGESPVAIPNSVLALYVNLSVGGTARVEGSSVQILSSGNISHAHGTMLFAKSVSADDVSGNQVEVVADSIGRLQGTIVVASASRVSSVDLSDLTCASADRIDAVVAGTVTLLSPKTANSIGQVGTLDLRQSNTTELLDMHVGTIIDCPNRVHVDTRLRLTNSTYDRVTLVDGPGC